MQKVEPSATPVGASPALSLFRFSLAAMVIAGEPAPALGEPMPAISD